MRQKLFILLTLLGMSVYGQALKVRQVSIDEFSNCFTKDSATILATFKKLGFRAIESKTVVCYDGPAVPALPKCTQLKLTNDTITATVEIKEDGHAQSISLAFKNFDKVHFKISETDILKNGYKLKKAERNNAYEETKRYSNTLNKDLEIYVSYLKHSLSTIYFTDLSSFPWN